MASKGGSFRVASAIPVTTGIGLRTKHYKDILATQPNIGWFEAHSENYFAEGGQPIYYLERVREQYPISLHGVGLSIGSTDPLNKRHLQRLKSLIQNIAPGLVSEHLSWGSVTGRYLNDLLPLPYTEEALKHVTQRIIEVQDYLARQILIENISSYLQYQHSTIPEWDFLAEVAKHSGCGILLDVNNIYVNSVNHNFDPLRYLDAISTDSVQEIHLAGFDHNGNLLIDTHSKPVYDEVWTLYRQTLDHFGRKPTLIEWDTDIPELAVLLDEAGKATDILQEKHHELIA